MNQWTFMYTTIDNSNYTTINGDIVNNSIQGFPSSLIGNFSNIVNISLSFSNEVKFIDKIYLDNSSIINPTSEFKNIKNIDALNDLSNCNTIFNSGFYNFINLISINNLYNTYNITNMSNYFSNCSSLVNIPILNMHSITNISNIFSNCNKLSNKSLQNISRSLPNVSQLDNNIDDLNTYVGLTNTQIEYISSTKYASSLQSKGWNIEDNYIKPGIIKSSMIKQQDGTMNISMLGADADYIEMEDGSTLENTIKDLKQYIDDNVENILGGTF